MDDNQLSNKNPDLISGRVMMGLIGLLAFLLPVILFISSKIIDNCKGVQYTISAYYYTCVGDALVGMTCALSFAFFAYRGYGDKKLLNDSLLGTLASVFALGVAFFPTSIDPYETSNCIDSFDNGIFGVVHYISAGLLFVTLAYFSLFQFTKSKEKSCFHKGVWNNLSKRKKSVNRLYITCGTIIVLCLFLIIVFFKLDKNGDLFKSLATIKPVFFLESIMLWAFSLAWLRKSKFFGKFNNEDLE